MRLAENAYICSSIVCKMTKQIPRRLIVWAAVAMVAVAALLLSVLPTSCHKTANAPARDAHYAVTDSLLRTVTDVDSLAAMAERYHQSGDGVGEMLARRHQGNRLRSVWQYKQAVEAHSQGFDVAVSLADTLEASAALSNIGTDYRRMGDLTTANGYYYRALKLCDIYKHPTDSEVVKCRVAALDGIVLIETEICNYTTADSLLRETLQAEIALGDPAGLAKCYGNMGLVKHNLGERDSAWYYYRKSMDYNMQTGEALGQAICHLRFGKLHEDERAYFHALEEYKQAYDLLKGQDNQWHIMDVCLALASLQIKLGEMDEAQRYLAEAEAMADRTGSKVHQAAAHEVHYELSLAQNHHEEALHYYVRSNELFDSIYGLNRDDEMRSQRIDYQGQRLNGELSMLNDDIARLKRVRNTQVVLTLLLLLMAGAIIAALVYAMRVRARTQRLMRQVEETRSLFFTNVVHQLRTPLTAIMGSIDAILDDVAASGITLSSSQQENVDIIQRQGNNLLVLVDRILEVGSVRSALREPEWRTGDAVTFMRMVLESYREQCVERHIELAYAPRESSVTIDTVPPYLNTIVGRLIENAIQYSRDFSKITVTSRVEGDLFVIRVADNGIGISPTDLPHVFEPFYRGAAAEQLFDGVGIGLTVVRDMTMAMDGTVAVESSEEQGTVFTVKLPCRHGGGEKLPFKSALEPIRKVLGERVTKRVAMQSADRHGGNLPIVMIVDDHDDVARLVGKVLGDDYEVHYAQDGALGLEMARQIMPDLIITDVKMPNVDGYEFCRSIRQTPSLCHIPIIMLSARTKVTDKVRGVEAGADAYLVKPFNPEEMRAWVNHLLECRKQLREVYGASAQPAAMAAAESQNADSAADDDRRFLDALAAEVDKRMAEGIKLDLDKIALTLKMGESKLRRKVQKLTGKNMAAYLMQLRMERAMSLLRNRPGMLIGEVAERCGFVDVAYFSRVFRQHYGMTPTQARSNPL